MSNSLYPLGLQPARLLFPWNSPGKNIAVVAIPFSMETSQPRDQTQVIFVFSYFCCEPKTPLKKLSLKFYFNKKQLRSLLTEV